MARTTERTKRGGRPQPGQEPTAKDIVLDELEEEYDFTPGEGDGDMFGGAPAKKAENFWPSFKRLMGLLKPEWLGMAWVTLLTVVSVVLVVIAPKILGDATNVIFQGVVVTKQGVDFTELGRLLTVVLAFYLVASLLQWWQGYLLNALVMRVIYGLRKDVEAKLNRLPLSYFDTRQRGDLMSRVTNDVDNIQTALQQAFSQLIQSVLMVIGIGIAMFIVSWQLALIALISIPLSGVIAGVIGSRSQKLFRTQWASTGALNGHIEESYSGLELVRAFGRDEVMLAEFDGRNSTLRGAQVGAQFVSGSIMPSMNFVSYLSYVLIAVIGALMVTGGTLTLGAAQAFIQYSREFSQPIGQIAGMANMLQSGVASAERTFEFLDSEEQTPDTDTEHLPERADGRVELDHVDFSYDPETELIQDLSLKVQPGSTVAIVGPTGAGKTTLVNLIMRFYELSGGTIRLDGIDTTRLSRAELRGQVGMVLQDAWLFSGTIRENIRYGRLDATDDEVIAAAKATMVDRFVRQLPDGYDTVIDAEGGNVSAGERQLITIARAFIANPSLLILDEATSSVDTRTELLVQHAMAALRTDRTSFVIAHRLSTIRDAHTILVMEHGRIVEQGDHATLLARRGAYYELYMTQFRGDDAESEETREEQEQAEVAAP
ncbi:multidrug ABC transporter ATP-binding protein [Leifsonia xyli]|uniref:ABC transporter ATP-binding protein n=1 Tax=Leifsonia xyli TaxID=1575 RepID=UPI0007CDA130|nr:multidrug ABC transporter ATP-binding protein [Leifsonia xyli]